MTEFTKMHGAGNDFLVFRWEEVRGRDLPELARRACDRHFGVGADGILVPAPSRKADLRMIYHNSDGSPSEMCGNGLRCLARYARDRNLVPSNALTVETGSGIHEVVLRDGGRLSRVEMGVPGFGPPVELGGRRFLRVSMGNPHAVAFLTAEEVESLNLRTAGPEVEHAPVFPDQTNVEFVHVRGPHELRMRIWERGAGETLASGSGSCAAAAAAIREGLASSPVRIILDGGEVEVEWAGGAEDVLYMSGPADYVCEGRLLL
ncbi:Diaminopimelate epimerase [Rubrobacter xylanophilus DSM 9941]|uniref:diaminopimelate epimerase n=1 Tax=Rubrobacter xylanophilus TaxID=49319 RepID=UPI001C6416A2|nr:diaminopimelate epimerase [Rubrobacter xylanophilus]QYJ16313.1 Diaminopimelate epimerase [Rubrobacter xylanophilus DSM 9941]